MTSLKLSLSAATFGFLVASTPSLLFPTSLAAVEARAENPILYPPVNGEDATPLLTSAIQQLAAQGGGRLRLAAGDFHLSSTLVIPSNTTLQGEGRGITRLFVPSGVDYDAIRLDSVKNVTLADFTIQENSFDAPKMKGRGVAIDNGSSDIRILSVSTLGMGCGFALGRAEGEEVSHITFRDCFVEKARQYGFDLAQCRVVLLDQCIAFRCYLDGIKLRKKTKDVTIRGGESSHNGTGPIAELRKLNGNGVDGFAGGNAFLIDGLVTEHNHGSGIYIKTGPLSIIGGGMVGNGMISNVRSRYNTGSGLDINRSSGDIGVNGEMFPLIGEMVVMGGVFESNTRAGIYLRGRQITLLAPIVKRNAKVGIEVATGSGISILGALVSANSLEEPGKRAGIEILGNEGPLRGVAVRDGAINGGDSELMTDSDDLKDSGEISHRAGIYVSKKVEDVTIEGVWIQNYRGEKAIDREQR